MVLTDQSLYSMANSDVNRRRGGNSIWAEETLSVHSWNSFAGWIKTKLPFLSFVLNNFEINTFLFSCVQDFLTLKNLEKSSGPGAVPLWSLVQLGLSENGVIIVLSSILPILYLWWQTLRLKALSVVVPKPAEHAWPWAATYCRYSSSEPPETWHWIWTNIS